MIVMRNDKIVAIRFNGYAQFSKSIGDDSEIF